MFPVEPHCSSGLSSSISCTGVQCLQVTPQGTRWASNAVWGNKQQVSYLWQKLFLSAFVCALCATPILDLAQVCELQSPGVLDSNQHACKLLPLLGCSFLLTSSLSLSLSKASHTWWWVNKVSPSPFSLFQSLIMERALCFFSGLGFAWGAWNWAYWCQSNHLHFCHSGSQCGYLSAWTQEGESREHKMILWR